MFGYFFHNRSQLLKTFENLHKMQTYKHVKKFKVVFYKILT